MSSGPDHYRLAEGYVEQARDLDDPTPLLAAAQVHATLALAAATAMNDAEGGMPVKDWDEWRTTVSASEPADPA